MPSSVRVTISVPDDLHRAIQAVRGRLLIEEAADVSYSSFIEILARAGVIDLLSTFPTSKPFPESDVFVLHRDLEGLYNRAAFGPNVDGDLPVGYMSSDMLPILLPAARARVETDSPGTVEHLESLAKLRALAPPPPPAVQGDAQLPMPARRKKSSSKKD